VSSALDRSTPQRTAGPIVARTPLGESFNRALGHAQANKGMRMSRSVLPLAGACVAALLLATAGSAQQSQPQQPPAQPVGLAVGELAPDFTISGATRYGVLRDSVRLSDFRGQTVVLAFFPKARTKG
jgi:hypothetical protein